MEKSNLAAAMKMTCPLKDWPEKLGISKPTLYKYIDLYSWGEESELDEKFVRKFDEILENTYNSCMIEYEKLQMKMIEAENTLAESLNKLRILRKEILQCEKEIRSVESDEKRKTLQNRKKELEMTVQDYSTNVELNEHRMVEMKSRLFEIEKIFGKPVSETGELESDSSMTAEESDSECNSVKWNDDVVRNLCCGSTGKHTILFDNVSDARTYVDILTKVSSEYVLVGRYDPQPGKNFVTVDDIASELECSYRITRIDVSGMKTTRIYPMKG